MVFGLASCTKDDANPTGNGSGGETPASLVGTEWTWNNGSINFVTETEAIVTVDNYHPGHGGDSVGMSAPKRGVFEATYTYSNGSGKLWMYIDGRQIEVPFTVSGNTMTATGTPDGDVTLTRVSNSPTQPDTLASLVGTSWSYYDGEANITVTFVTSSDVRVLASTPAGPEEGYGTYSYSNGSGSMQLDMNDTTYYITFTVSGNTLTAYGTPAGTVTLTRAGSNPQPGPGPTPGGDYPLNNTAWQSSFVEDSVNITMTVAFGTTNCTMDTYVNGYPSGQVQGTYTYNGTITSGQGIITLYGEAATFVVNGSEASVTADGETHVFTRIRK